MQLAVFCIATAFLAAGRFFTPAAGGHEPRFQRLGVNVLFIALVAVVLGGAPPHAAPLGPGNWHPVLPCAGPRPD